MKRQACSLAYCQGRTSEIAQAAESWPKSRSVLESSVTDVLYSHPKVIYLERISVVGENKPSPVPL